MVDQPGCVTIGSVGRDAEALGLAVVIAVGYELLMGQDLPS